ncbi:MAG: hypothetical protein NTY53_03800 [Kiritimatiellaeota bacterium]|nr:hypothetical protein [Kiritimatiellota bacterium]
MKDSAKEDDIFPWKEESAAIVRIVRLGRPVAPYLLERLESIQHFYDGEDFDFKVQQNITVALCRIYRFECNLGSDVPSYGVRHSHEHNLKAFAYWSELAHSTTDPATIRTFSDR